MNKQTNRIIYNRINSIKANGINRGIYNRISEIN